MICYKWFAFVIPDYSILIKFYAVDSSDRNINISVY